ncbi:hypothetical protein [Streptomyces sp. NPDC127595]|uniref:hypothetical protein n=1 Tax=Streptomyces sp. NPDC127595 TaxID=3345405 RepID=UPI00362B377A
MVLGIGVGILMQSTLLTTMNTAPPRDMGAATGTVTPVRTIGGSLGVAARGAVHLGRMTGELSDRLGERTAEQLTSGGEMTPQSVDGMSAGLRAVVQEAFTGGLHGVLIGTALLSAAAFALAGFVRGNQDLKSPGTAGDSPGIQLTVTSAD